MYLLLRDWKPDLVLAGPVCLPLVLMMDRAFGIPIVPLSLQLMRACKSVAPIGFEWLPRSLRMPVWGLLVRVMLRKDYKKWASHISKLTNIPTHKLRISTSDFYRYSSASPAFLAIIATSPTIYGELPQEFNSNSVQIGGLIASTQQQSTMSSFGAEKMAVMEDFLRKGRAPIYMGFGSIIGGTSKLMTLLCLRALKKTGERGILVRGWSKMSLEDLEGEADEEELRAYAAENVLFLDAAPHGWLFPRCQVVVHHGGAGTSNASILSGRPTVIVPIFLDQFAHAKNINEKGIGVGLDQMAKVAPEELAMAIQKCIQTPSIQENAKRMAEKLAKEDGPGRLVEVIKDYMESHIKTGRHMAIKRAIEKRLGGIPCPELNGLSLTPSAR